MSPSDPQFVKGQSKNVDSYVVIIPKNSHAAETRGPLFFRAFPVVEAQRIKYQTVQVSGLITGDIMKAGVGEFPAVYLGLDSQQCGCGTAQ